MGEGYVAYHGEHERIANAQGEGGLCRLIHRYVAVGVQQGDAHLVDYGVIGG